MKLKSVRAVARALTKADVRCLFAGGIAVVAHGYGRMTYDIAHLRRLLQDDERR